MNENSKTYPLSTIIDDEDSQSMEQEEAFYYHTINDLVDLIVEHGFDTVMGDVYLQLIDKEGWE